MWALLGELRADCSNATETQGERRLYKQAAIKLGSSQSGRRSLVVIRPEVVTFHAVHACDAWENSCLELGLGKVPLCSTHENLRGKPPMSTDKRANARRAEIQTLS